MFYSSYRIEFFASYRGIDLSFVGDEYSVEEFLLHIFFYKAVLGQNKKKKMKS